MNKMQLCLDTFYIEFNIDKFANISKRYVSFSEKKKLPRCEYHDVEKSDTYQK